MSIIFIDSITSTGTQTKTLIASRGLVGTSYSFVIAESKTIAVDGASSGVLPNFFIYAFSIISAPLNAPVLFCKIFNTP
mgnify:CR=1 FL=1